MLISNSDTETFGLMKINRSIKKKHHTGRHFHKLIQQTVNQHGDVLFLMHLLLNSASAIYYSALIDEKFQVAIYQTRIQFPSVCSEMSLKKPS